MSGVGTLSVMMSTHPNAHFIKGEWMSFSRHVLSIKNLSRGTGHRIGPSESEKGQVNKPVTRSREPAHLDSLEALCRDGHRVHTVRIM